VSAVTAVALRAQMPYEGRDAYGRPCPVRWHLYGYTGPNSTRLLGEVWQHGRGQAARFTIYLRGRGATRTSYTSIDDALTAEGLARVSAEPARLDATRGEGAA
jgi:hypothetical protein